MSSRMIDQKRSAGAEAQEKGTTLCIAWMRVGLRVMTSPRRRPLAAKSLDIP